MRNGSTLEVNLPAIVRNYQLLRDRLAGGHCAAVVKADAYGLGAAHVAPALYGAGCRHFFVATSEEGMELRKIMPADEAAIYVFHGVHKEEVRDCAAYRLIPVLNCLTQMEAWKDAGPCALHIDTGMNRLGLTLEEAEGLSSPPPNLRLVMSHLACANEPDNPMNRRQLADFRKALTHFKGVPASLANSSGIFLGPDFHFDLSRPGCSLYGITSNSTRVNPVENVVTLTAPILQYRHIKMQQSVGYGASAQAKAGSVLATVEFGYADGFLRHLSNKASGLAAGVRVPLIGRVSMDMLMFDVSAVPEHLRDANLRIMLIGDELPVDKIAKDAGTIGYEILTRLGSRVKRVYKQ